MNGLLLLLDLRRSFSSRDIRCNGVDIRKALIDVDDGINRSGELLVDLTLGLELLDNSEELGLSLDVNLFGVLIYKCENVGGSG